MIFLNVYTMTRWGDFVYANWEEGFAGPACAPERIDPALVPKSFLFYPSRVHRRTDGNGRAR